MDWAIIIPLVSTVLSAVVLFVVKKIDSHATEKEDLRREENDLMFRCVDAVGELAEITAKCYKSGSVMNGNLDRAIAKREATKEARQEYLIKCNNIMKRW